MVSLMKRVERHRHIMLLVVIIVGLTIQPIVRWPATGPLVSQLIAYSILLAVFLAIFQHLKERWIGFAMAVPAVSANLVEHASTGTTKLVAAMIYHGCGMVFIGMAVIVILRGVFRSGKVGVDEIAGAFCGYMLTGVLFGNAYMMIDLLVPNAFQIAQGLVWHLEADDTRRSLFNYYSFTTLTTMGYGDVTPLAPAACTLAWLEAMFGQYYLAVLIGQLMGIKLAQGQLARATKS